MWYNYGNYGDVEIEIVIYWCWNVWREGHDEGLMVIVGFTVMAQNTSYNYWNNPIYGMYDRIEITSYNL
jgi:hypothetical protein